MIVFHFLNCFIEDILQEKRNNFRIRVHRIYLNFIITYLRYWAFPEKVRTPPPVEDIRYPGDVSKYPWISKTLRISREVDDSKKGYLQQGVYGFFWKNPLTENT